MQYACLWLEAPEAELTGLREDLPPRFQGEIRHRKGMRDGVVVRGPAYWQSPRFSRAGTSITDSAIECLHTYLPTLQRRFGHRVSDSSAGDGERRLILSVVGMFGSIAEARGLHVSGELVRLLAQAGAELDYDIAAGTGP